MDPNNPNFSPNPPANPADPNTALPTPDPSSNPFAASMSAPSQPATSIPPQSAVFPDLGGISAPQTTSAADTTLGVPPAAPAEPTPLWNTTSTLPSMPASPVPEPESFASSAPALGGMSSPTEMTMPLSAPTSPLDAPSLQAMPSTPAGGGLDLSSMGMGNTTPQAPSAESLVPPAAADTSTQSSSFPWASNSVGTGILSTPEPPVSAETPPSPESSSAPDLAPTDLSHLVGVPITPEASAAPVPAPTTSPETLVVAPQTMSTDSQPVVAASGSKGFPKWILLVGVLVVILVAAGSAYFILGIGKPEESTTSVPDVKPPLTNSPKTILPTVPSASSGSTVPAGGFGELTGSGSAMPQTTISPANGSATSGQSGSSAIDLLRQRSQLTPTP